MKGALTNHSHPTHMGRGVRRKRHPNHRLVKIPLTYTVEEIATLLGVHRNTIREWIKRGLELIDKRRPVLILGRHLVAFLQERRKKNKQKCQPGEIYCVRCRTPQKPAGDMAEYKPMTTKLGNLIGICPRCGSMIYRRVNRTKLGEILGNLDIMMPEARRHISERPQPSLNSDLERNAETHENAQLKQRTN